MALLGYQKWKAEKVESGECRQTIRADRKTAIRVGERLHHYTGLRTKACRKLRAGIEDRCVETIPVSLMVFDNGTYKWLVRGAAAMKRELEDIARRDGFGSVDEMTVWFTEYHLDPKKKDLFTGNVIRW